MRVPSSIRLASRRTSSWSAPLIPCSQVLTQVTVCSSWRNLSSTCIRGRYHHLDLHLCRRRRLFYCRHRHRLRLHRRIHLLLIPLLSLRHSHRNDCSLLEFLSTGLATVQSTCQHGDWGSCQLTLTYIQSTSKGPSCKRIWSAARRLCHLDLERQARSTWDLS